MNFRVTKYSAAKARIALECTSDAKKIATLSMTELVAKIVTEDAEIIDELDEPDISKFRTRPVTDLSKKAIHRIIDWHILVIMLRMMIPYLGSGPKSRKFQEGYACARRFVLDAYAATSVASIPVPTAWTLYRAILTWRSHRFTYASLSTKGFDYRPWAKKSEIHELAADIARKLHLENPNLSVAAIHVQVNKILEGEVPRKKRNSAEELS